MKNMDFEVFLQKAIEKFSDRNQNVVCNTLESPCHFSAKYCSFSDLSSTLFR